MSTVATITIPLDQAAVDWLRAARDKLAPDMTDAELLAWLAARGHELLHTDIVARLERQIALDAHAATLAQREAWGDVAPPPAAEFGGTP